MKMLLELEKFRLDGQVLRHRQPARSFLRNFINLLYTQFAQSNYSMTDSDGTSRTVVAVPTYRMPNLAVVPGAIYYQKIPQESVGIRVGGSDNPVTPTDYDLAGFIHHVDGAPETSPVVKDAYYYPYSTGYQTFYGANWLAAPFFVPQSVDASAVRLRLYRYGNLPTQNLIASIRKTDGYNSPVGGDLCSGQIGGLNSITTDSAGDWYEVTFGSQYVLRPNTQYAIVVRIDGGDASNNLRWLRSSGGTLYRPHKDGTCLYATSSNSGASWTPADSNRHNLFYQLLGKRPLGLCYHGTLIREFTFPAPPPGAQFSLEAFFSNYCGSPVSVREAGIYASGATSDEYRAFVFLIARDILSPAITVNSGEVLRVRYVVQITV